MDSQNNQNEDLQRREKELRDREHALRLRELEMEIQQQSTSHQPPISPTTKHQPPESALKQRYRQALNVVKFVGIVVAVVVAVRIATWLATAVLVGGIAWVAYKLFFDNKQQGQGK